MTINQAQEMKPGVHIESEVMSEQPNDSTPLPSAAELRAAFENVISSSAESNRELGDIVKVMDLGEAKNMITDTLTTIAHMSRPKDEGRFTRTLRKFGLAGAVDKVKDNAEVAKIEGQSVREVSENLLSTIQTKKAHVDNVFSKMVGMKDSLAEGYTQMKAMTDGINAHMDEFSESDRYHMVNLKAEILETMSYQEDNIRSAVGAIKAAETAATQFSQMIPKLRAQVNDAATIRGALAELTEMSEMVQIVDETCAALREDNRETMEGALIGILDKATVSDKQLALIDANQKSSQEFQQKLANKYAEVEKRKGEVVQRLEAVVGRTDNLIESK